jgi:hypothetical protein
MKRCLKLANLFFLWLIVLNASGQDSKQRLWELSMGGGVSLPVGTYSHKNPSESAIIDNSLSFTRIIGIAKEKSGFAKAGFNYNLEIKYKLSSNFRLSISAGKFINPIETNGMSDYFSQVTREVEVVESDYKISYIMPGIGYSYLINNLDFDLNLNAGFSGSDFPYYKFILLFTTNPHPIFAHDGPEPNLHAFAMGASISVNYNISSRVIVGIEAFYQQSNFAYHMSNHVIPGGSAVFEIDDVLKVRVINTALRLGYVF